MLNFLHKTPESSKFELIKQLSISFIRLHQAPVILCIGSDKVTGDSLGPLVGHLLRNIYNVNTYIYGTLSAPINASNLEDTISFIKSNHPNRQVLVVDACLGLENNIGTIRFHRQGIYPGAGSGKSFARVGDFSITAVVAPTSYRDNNYSAFVPLGKVFKLADIISSAIAGAFFVISPYMQKTCSMCI